MPLLFPFSPKSSSSGLTTLEVNVANCSVPLAFGLDETYSLSVPMSGQPTLKANTVWGAMHGLETFSQLIEWNSASQRYVVYDAPLTIHDQPRFGWRGLMIDTARHYLSVDTILRAIDAASYNKLNVLHWHTVDAQSFPIVVEAYPRLSGNGSWAPRAVYSHQDISKVVSYGHARGVRVIPEFDVPGHAYSWGDGYPEITTDCPQYEHNINNIPLSPASNLTLEVVRTVFSEMTKNPPLFTDDYFHIGGDEVVYGCWLNDPKVVQWMNSHGLQTGFDVYQYFEENFETILSQLNKKLIVWQEVFIAGIQLPKDAIVQVWKNSDVLQSVINAGHQTVNSAGWYLDQQIPNPAQTYYEWVDTWKDFYSVDLTADLHGSPEQLALVLGGEAAMWGEQVDSVNFDSRVWPRACGATERLWSPGSVTDITDATQRMAKFRCSSLARRGIGAGPIQPDYCELPTSSKW
eukprot:CAMPEP_0201556738 /NCGR_PEP_ID=MMETSP0173_2-20130828/57426_1 /ASSEMBLY_ACC=CAM_ASM_000268 /TAXON_ID=218659 /ORGANISM="Vexillifera sp., Strain DIVA3 564/2" /LENGTH=461 /DNA_ID=CAMNT_0047969195 /DNA_START=233 /DNA_END=1615 /DNA_ORIENTATION=-